MIETSNTPSAVRRCKSVLVGSERSPLLIVDDFFDRPDALVDYAATACEFRSVQNNYYPGIRAPAPAPYVEFLAGSLEKVVREAFGLGGIGFAGADCNFSLVTTAPKDLQFMQIIPHFDATDLHQIAVVHYLCTPDKGGTSFYRHRSTGYETITLERRESYLERLDADLKASGLPEQAYINGDTEIYERLASVEARFNRLVLYRSAVLHSGNIPRDFGFSRDVRAGRLTLNTFLYFR